MKSISNQKGFTLIELVIVILVLGILVSIALPAYYDLRGDAITATRKANAAATKSSYAIAIADIKTYPTVAQIRSHMTGSNITAIASGIQVVISGVTYVVPTYKTSACNTLTANSTSDTVGCIGDIAEVP